MTHTLRILFLVFASAAVSAGQQPSQQQKDAMLAKMRPGPEHKRFAGLVGRWTQEIKYTAGPTNTTIVKGTATNRLILGGRFLLSERTAVHPDAASTGESALEAVNVYGFDRRTNEYTILELDSMGTYWVSATGAARPDGTIVMTGETLDDHAGSRELRKYDMTLKIVDANTYTTTIVFKLPGRPDMTIAEGTYRRLQ